MRALKKLIVVGLMTATTQSYAANGDLTVSGNLGIGTTSYPATKLHVSGPITNSGGAANLDGVSLTWLSSGFVAGWNRSSGWGETDFISDKGPGIQGVFAFIDKSGGTENWLMRIRENGNVGIGTVNPLAKLTIYDSGTFNPFTSTALKTVTFGDVQVGTWHATGMCSGNSTSGGGPVCLTANDGAWWFGSQPSASTIYATASLSPLGNLWIAGALAQYSDETLKKDIQDIPDVLLKLKKIKAVYYKWKDPAKTQARQAGVIAQDVEKVLPELVIEVDSPACMDKTVECNEPKLKSVDYPKLSAIALQGVNALSDKVDALEKRLADIEKKLAGSTGTN